MAVQNRLMGSSTKAPHDVTTAEIVVSATGLTLLMIVMIEAAFLFW